MTTLKSLRWLIVILLVVVLVVIATLLFFKDDIADKLANQEIKRIAVARGDNFDYQILKKYSKAKLRTNRGEFSLLFYAKSAPKTVAYLMNLIKDDAMVGLKFEGLKTNSHLFSQPFVLGSEGKAMADLAGFNFLDERNEHRCVTGTVAIMTDHDAPGRLRIFIVSGPEFDLGADNNLTVFGRLVSGQDDINQLPAKKNGRLVEELIIESVELIP